MTAPALLSLVATVLAVDGQGLHLDKGLLDGLRRGDEGRVAYELQVGSESRTIEVARGVVERIEATAAELAIDPPAEVRPGYLVRFEIPAERIRASSVLAGLAQISDENERRAALRLWADRQIPREPWVEGGLLAALWDRVARAGIPSESGSESGPGAPLLHAAGGVYQVGVDPPAATHYDQQPSFHAHLAPFWIDRRVPAAAAGAGYHEAEALCRARGMRLPTELEWEVAATRLEGFELAGLFEWTSSWYLPYPGNEHPEAAYGRSHRVLRGSPAPDASTPRVRRYAEPATRLDEIGFRCATSSAPDASPRAAAIPQ